MPSSALGRFQRRLALVAYFRHVFGVGDVHDPGSIRVFYNALKEQREGYDAEGRSHVYHALKERVRGIPPAKFLAYDENVRRHTEVLNRARTQPIVLKYFQVLAALMTEHYLDRATHEPDAFLLDLNAFTAEQTEARKGAVDFPTFVAGDLNKLAFWMATGSGKTLLMHLNYYQYLHYRSDTAENILLVTPKAGLSEQHMDEMTKSSVPCRRFDAATSDLFGAHPQTVKVIEITKLTEEKTGGGVSVDVSHLEGRNLVFVDEGHKGAGSEAQAWRSRRAAIAEQGFTFEYSATFGQGIGGAGPEIEEEYGKAILFDYSYPRFYDDGYGKDYRIVNLEQDLTPDLTDQYLLANLLTFYEQLRCYETNRNQYYDEYNIQSPLLVFIGHTVTAGKTWSGLGKTDRQSLSDVQEQVLLLQRVLANEKGWVPSAIDSILTGSTDLKSDGRSIFTDAFHTLRNSGLDGAKIYADLLRRVFHVPASTALHLVNLHSAEGEIALRAATADRFFGLINVGDAAHFLRLAEEKLPEVEIVEERFTDSLFRAIKQQDSPINVLIGAKKFIEGWDSWRVSTMGLMNIGRGEGPEIIQLFGRGVRLLGRGRSLKRSSEIEGAHPDNLPLLETLSIFGVRASYMAQFRDYLAEEGIDVDPRLSVQIETRPGAAFEGKGLLVIRPQLDVSFQEAVRLRLEVDGACLPVIDLMPRTDVLVSDGLTTQQPDIGQDQVSSRLPENALPLIDWHRLYRHVWQFRTAHGYTNLAIDREVLKRILVDEQYILYCPPGMLKLASFSDVRRIEDIGLMILRKYVERYYTGAHRQWEQDQMVYQLLDADDENLIGVYEAQVKASDIAFLETLEKMRDDTALYEGDEGNPPRIHFDRHLYLPLLLAYEDADPRVKYTPPGLNRGEHEFVRKLRTFAGSAKGQELLSAFNLELFLLRNRSRGRGVGFMVDGEGVFPDFILWLKGPDHQDIVFIEPHGLIAAGDLDVNPKVQFYSTIKEYEQKLNKRAGRDDIALHSHLISRTPFEQMITRTRLDSHQEFNQWHIYFPDQALCANMSETTPSEKLVYNRGRRKDGTCLTANQRRPMPKTEMSKYQNRKSCLAPSGGGIRPSTSFAFWKKSMVAPSAARLAPSFAEKGYTLPICPHGGNNE